MDAVTRPPPEIVTELSKDVRPRTRRQVWVGLIAIPTALLIGGAIYRYNSSPPITYVTEEVIAGSLSVTVTASGHLEPRRQITVGSEASGKVLAVKVDVNDQVRAGQILLVLDSSRLQAQLVQATSAAESAQAKVHQCGARLRAAIANYGRLLRAREMSRNRLPSQQQLGRAEAAMATANGEMAAAYAALEQARAQREAIQADLSTTVIRSPIDGIVLARLIEPGQVVAAALEAPMLFVLAEDPRQMELHVAVDEADIGALRVGQWANVSVDAFPDLLFEARTTRVHLAPNNKRSLETARTSAFAVSEQSEGAVVVTYEAVLGVENPELLLRPGMSAVAAIVTGQISQATLVPDSARRFTPARARLPRMDDAADRGPGVLLMPDIAGHWKCPKESGQALGCVWVLENGHPALAVFKPGATDRTMTQVLPLERLPSWESLVPFRNDEILKQALRRKLAPGVRVIVGQHPVASE